MLLSRSINKRRGAFLLCLLLSGTGCAKKTAVKPPAPRPVFVRLAPLVADAPLQAEVARLRRIEADLRGQAVSPPLSAIPNYSLPALPAGSGSPVSRTALAARQKAQADVLRRQVAAELTAFLQEYDRRQAQLRQQREVELRGTLIARDGEYESAERERIYQEILALLQGNSPNTYSLLEQKLKLLAKRTISSAQLNNAEQPLVVLNKNKLPAFGTEADTIVDTEVARLETDSKVSGVSERARLKYRFDTAESKLIALNDKIRAIKADGEARVAAVTKDAADKRDKEIADALAKYGGNAEFRARLLEQGTAIEQAIAAEQKNAARLLLVNEDNAARAVRVEALFGGASPGSLSADSTRRAADRIAAQRTLLERTIERTMQERVRDLARVQNVDVRIVSSTDANILREAAVGRTDATTDFLRLLRPTLP